MTIRPLRIVTVAAASVLLAQAAGLGGGLGLAPVAPPSTVAVSDSVSADEVPEGALWIVGNEDQSFAERVELAVEANPDIADDATAVLDDLQAAIAAGDEVNLPGSPGGSGSDSDAISDAQESVETVVDEQEDQNVALVDQAGEPVDQVRLAADGPLVPSSPTDFELRGFEKNDARSWSVKTELDGGYCYRGACNITDKVKTTWTVDPGREGDKFSFTSLYATNSGNFQNIFADIYSDCSGSECGRNTAGDSGNRDGTGKGVEYVSHKDQAGKTLRQRIRMRATFIPNSTRYYDGVKTGTAKCKTGSNRSCPYV
ncbi:hypothetical protein [Aeromicrobium sp.]|uniref:hypothetical protein n=1 Tax=Aeromicrobium sp. TaxID=1871063 RepID=UPI00199505D1|nr:hypothetical protein [Aeromicrobium sp.]MBC7632974.1 hypothetical protein [Aeromicrobium sp.]